MVQKSKMQNFGENLRPTESHVLERKGSNFQRRSHAQKSILPKDRVSACVGNQLRPDAGDAERSHLSHKQGHEIT